VLLGLVDLVVEHVQNSQIGGENRCAASPFGCWQAQSIGRGLVKLLSLAPLQPHTSAGGEGP